MLADAGAEVVKVEPPPQGDFIRQVPFAIDEWTSGIFLQGNSGKKSIALDVRSDAGRRVVDLLAAESDVIIHNLRPAAAKRLDFTIDRFARMNARVVFCEISGYGTTPELALRPGQDLGIQADAGISSLTGLEDGPIAIPTWSVADTVTAAHTFNAICIALLKARTTNTAQHVEMSMLDCTAQLHDTGPFVASALEQGERYVTRAGRFHPTLVVRGVLRTTDGYVAISGYRPRDWSALSRLLGPPWDSEEYCDWRKRVQKRSAICQTLDERFRERTTGEVVDALAAARVPCAPVEADWARVAADERFRRRGSVVAWTDSHGRERVLGGRAHDQAQARVNLVDRGGPRMGEHCVEILRRVGLDTSEVLALYGDGIIAMEPIVFEEFAKLLGEA